MSKKQKSTRRQSLRFLAACEPLDRLLDGSGNRLIEAGIACGPEKVLHEMLFLMHELSGLAIDNLCEFIVEHLQEALTDAGLESECIEFYAEHMELLYKAMRMRDEALRNVHSNLSPHLKNDIALRTVKSECSQYLNYLADIIFDLPEDEQHTVALLIYSLEGQQRPDVAFKKLFIEWYVCRYENAAVDAGMSWERLAEDCR